MISRSSSKITGFVVVWSSADEVIDCRKMDSLSRSYLGSSRGSREEFDFVV